MFHVLIDTCVWLDLAKDHKQESLLSVLWELTTKDIFQLIVPEIVVEEFNRNKGHVAKDGVKSLASAIKRAQEAVNEMGNPKNKKTMQSYLSDVGHRIPQLGNDALHTLGSVEKLLASVPALHVSDSVLARAAKRGITKKAPFHRGKNSMNDAILIEMFEEYKKEHAVPGHRFAFVTHNKHDFSSPVDERLPHPDIASYFSRVKSQYSINLGVTLKKVAPESVTDMMMRAEFDFVPRTQSEILKEEDILTRKIWYNRHHNWLYRIDKGQHKIVPRSAYTGDANTTPDDIFQGARKAAQQLEKKFASGELGPWDDFEWGMLNGKLSALRWALGYEWDNLDT